MLDNNLDPYNDNELQSMAHQCHNRKSGRDAHKSRGDGYNSENRDRDWETNTVSL